MNTFLDIFDSPASQKKQLIATAFQVLGGSLFLALTAQIVIPLYPVPITMQTFGLIALSFFLGGKKASLSALTYLAFLSLGLPFLAGGKASALWFAMPRAGYLAAFPLSAYLMGTIKERMKRGGVASFLTAT